ncbi:VOC family protein [Gilvimarinus agarilyticus]|uniref:VOC family protein n=1 Tax=Gilvimarinus agarilyticus TaxID=679259 RepID=UPI0005A1AA93|nr:VOC family protein [Gilvimarinus agarilyticus]
MQVSDVRVFIPSKDYQASQSFYQALGFKMSKASDDLSIFECGDSTFFLQRYYNKEFADNLMLQLIVPNIEEAYATISGIKNHDFRFEPIKTEGWGKVIYLWGPSGELWHITELLG